MKKLLILFFALALAVFPACATDGNLSGDNSAGVPPTQTVPDGSLGQGGADNGQGGSTGQGGASNGQGNQNGATGGDQTQEVQKTTKYIKVVGAGVNVRSGAGTSHTSMGVAEKDTLFANLGEVNGWIKTRFKNSVAYISKKYCEQINMLSASDKIEKVIAEGAKFLGVKYVYGAVRYHDGYGNKLKNFTTTAFDCSSLMQYAFKIAVNVNLQVTTRTQVKQGTTISRKNLKRGDLMFFTNETRKNKTGVERIGHVALYLGDNLILHTASDYAKIESISSARWSFFIQGQRII